MEIVIIIFLVFAAIVLIRSVRFVPQGYHFTIERFGKYVHTKEPGFALLYPLIDSVGRKMNMMEQVLDVPSQEVITRDNAVVKVDGVVFFQVLDAPKAAYQVSVLERAVLNLVMTNIRTVLGSMDLDESLSKRDEINARLLSVVDEATHPWGIKVNRIEIKDITPPRDLVDAMARQMKAEREKRATILEAEGARQGEILRADGEKQAAILEAEGKKEAAFREAEARERLAEAEAKATMMVSQAIAKGDLQAINYFVADKYIHAIKAIASSPNQKLLMLPVEATGVLGSLAGVAELAKEALTKQRSSGEGLSVFDLTVWQWWLAAGFLLLIAEIFAPGVFMIWFGVAAVILGLITWLIPALPWALQAVLFASLSVAFVLYYRHLKAKYNTEGSDQPLLNKPLAQMIGQVHALHTAIENGRGKIKIGDSLWSVRGPDMPAGERVRILAVQDLVLEVEAAG